MLGGLAKARNRPTRHTFMVVHSVSPMRPSNDVGAEIVDAGHGDGP